MQLVWNEFLKIIKEEAGSQVVETWFKAVHLSKWDKDTQTAFLVMPNQFVKKWIEEHYTHLIKVHLSRLLHIDTLKLYLTCEDNVGKTLMPASPLHSQVLLDQSILDKSMLDKSMLDKSMLGKSMLDKSIRTNMDNLKLPVSRKSHFITKSHKKMRLNSKLNPNYTFKSLVVGPNNSLAHAAAVAISQNIGKVYNPLFIYGKTGLGKTHLLHSIGNELKSKNKSAVVLYETSDTFINEYINSIKTDTVNIFRDKYKKIDLLLLDDIQFFSNKEQTQETFFHIFDMLHSHNKQVVFSSDTLPRDIFGLQSRLKSRLQCGLVADIQIPSLETKLAILKSKADKQKLFLDDEVANFVASQPISSIRELEGCLIRLSAFASLSKRDINIDLAKHVFSHASTNEKSNKTLESVIKCVSKCCDISTADIKSKKRNQNIVIARQIAFFMMKQATKSSFQAMGMFVGGRDHTTALHSVTKIERLKESNWEISKKISLIQKELKI